ncbi:MAG: GatB/YqeY domain-containing protein [Patescibacteria group bacterium]|nr:GatB/YqeY domain-containing protein [Patescibacteria group bacterium]
MTLHQTIKDQIKDALRAKDTIRLDTLRGLVSSFQNEIVMGKAAADEAGLLPDDKALALVKRSAKQRKDSIEQFVKGGREDLAAKEREELAILESFLPALMPREEIAIIAKARLEALKAAGSFDAKSPASAGKLTGALMKELAGKADGADVKAVVDSLLTK